jgi:ketosteroid isomerase-like protein
MAATFLAFALFGALIGFAADRWLASNTVPSLAPIAAAPAPTVGSVPRVGPVAKPNGASPTTAPTPATSTGSAPAVAGAAADPAQQAIQQVIQRGDEEQAQAIAANDASVMADTSTPDFYQQQVQINQDLTSNGVSAIKLINVEWGPITVSGTTATATAWETWTTTYTDGTTDQSRDRNVYALVQDTGTWKVSADAHPDDVQGNTPGTGTGTGAPGGQGNGNASTGRQPANPGPSQRTAPSQPSNPPQPTTPSQPTTPIQPRQPRGQGGQGSQGVSQNWSGYAASGGTYTAVSGTWTVPQFTPDSPAGADAAWVGIGGVTSNDLIQAGTQQTVSGSGSTQYQAWVETLPQASHPVPLAVHSGDSVSVSITQQPQAQDQWLVAFTNNTTGQTYQVTEHYTSSMSSAEWIEEAPSAARGRQLPLDNFGTIDFSAGSATKNGQPVTITSSGAQAVTMVGRGGQQLAKPSALGADGASFTVSRG